MSNPSASFVPRMDCASADRSRILTAFPQVSQPAPIALFPAEAMMTEIASDSARDNTVMILAPTGRDTPLTCALLRDRGGIPCELCSSVADLCASIRQGLGVAIIAEEALDISAARRLLKPLSEQLPWSDLPVLVLVNHTDIGVGSPIATLQQRGNVTVLERPVRILTLLTAVQSALRARRRQYEVRDLLAQTRAAIRHRDQFLAMLGHELRNPLGAIGNAMSVLDAACSPPDDLEREQRDIIRRQNEHLARLVDDLLDVSRITSGKVTLQKRSTDLCDLIRRAATSVSGLARAQRHNVMVKPAGEPVFVDGDPVRLEQVINNLMTNAIKYTPAGGRIELSVAAEGNDAVLRVIDNGIGIAPELLSRVFDLFTQAEPALDRSQGGLGIGLTLVRALVEMHSGTVAVESEGPGKGSGFTIRLPRVAPSRVEPPVRRAPAPSHQGAGRRILIIEDQPDARRALQRLLQVWGHQVEVADDGPGGLERAMAFLPDIALIDVGLPGLDGYEVARRIRAARGNTMKLVALTGYGQPEDRERAYEAGFDLHLVKPVDRDQLLRALADSDMMVAHENAGRT
jgi:signal transduction histidine kinase/CheY-like chemotaxis protein